MIKRIREWWSTPMVRRKFFDDLKSHYARLEEECEDLRMHVYDRDDENADLIKRRDSLARMNSALVKQVVYLRSQLAEARSDKQATLEAVAKERAHHEAEREGYITAASDAREALTDCERSGQDMACDLRDARNTIKSLEGKYRGLGILFDQTHEELESARSTLEERNKYIEFLEAGDFSDDDDSDSGIDFCENCEGDGCDLCEDDEMFDDEDDDL